jgi:putative CocE/NonD family hydrolase
MRDGTQLFTAVYVPKDASRTYPIMLERTPYSLAPYGADAYPDRLGPSEAFARDGFIFASQDVRGRFMSEGLFVDMRPHRQAKRTARDTDESSDTWDTIDWLVKHVPNNNGRVGMWGISYDGFFVAAGMIDAHPALKAASPQAPIGDCYLGDDCYHNGVLWLPHNFSFYNAFFHERAGGPSPPVEPARFAYGTPDGYDYYLQMGAVGNSKALIQPPNKYWNDTVDHTTYDDFWQQRAITRFFRQLPPAVMTVGGWFDAEDLSGALRVFRAAEKVSPADNHLVMGPWRHGGWAAGEGDRLGNLSFGSNTAAFYRQQIEFAFFLARLKDAKAPALPKASVFQTGSNRWRQFAEWPPRVAAPVTYHFAQRGALVTQAPAAGPDAFDEYVSDPSRPVPFVSEITQNMPPDYMTEDQRFAARRPDVLVYQTEPLAEDVSVAGPIDVSLFVSTTGTDSDFVVKVIDVYPGDDVSPASVSQDGEAPGEGRAAVSPVKMGGYQQLVRGEPFRGKFRHGFERAEAFEPGKIASIRYTMPDACHTFRKGHRIMVQVQSSWFPLGDRNPQTFTDIPTAKPADFRKATERVYRTEAAASGITLLVER